MNDYTSRRTDFESVESPFPDSPFVVMKFGGRSVSTAENWSRIAELLRSRLDSGLRPVVVHSALAGVSDALEALIEAAVDSDPTPILDDIRATHDQLAVKLGVDSSILDDHFRTLAQLIDGVRLLREVSPGVHARVMATGELAATTLGAHYLQAGTLPAHWWDARELLETTEPRNLSERAQFLSASCAHDTDKKLQQVLEDVDGFIVTQGFIGRNSRGDTVLFGRGGSDTSGAYLAARLQARRLEIWSDVPGFFSADPKAVPSARLLRELTYSEAQEIASAGGGLLASQRSISPVRRCGIPHCFSRSPAILNGKERSFRTRLGGRHAPNQGDLPAPGYYAVLHGVHGDVAPSRIPGAMHSSVSASMGYRWTLSLLRRATSPFQSIRSPTLPIHAA